MDIAGQPVQVRNHDGAGVEERGPFLRSVGPASSAVPAVAYTGRRFETLAADILGEERADLTQHFRRWHPGRTSSRPVAPNRRGGVKT